MYVISLSGSLAMTHDDGRISRWTDMSLQLSTNVTHPGKSTTTCHQAITVFLAHTQLNFYKTLLKKITQ